MCRLKYYSIDFCVRVAAVDQYENPDSWVLFQKSLCELMCVSKISSFHLDKKCAAIYYLLRWPLPPNDPKCVTQYFETLIRIGPGSWRWLIYGALSKKCPYNSCWLLIQIVQLRPFDWKILNVIDLKYFCENPKFLFPYTFSIVKNGHFMFWLNRFHLLYYSPLCKPLWNIYQSRLSSAGRWGRSKLFHC